MLGYIISDKEEIITNYISSMRQTPELNVLNEDFLNIYEYLINFNRDYNIHDIEDTTFFISEYDNFVLHTQKKLDELYEKIKLINSKNYTMDEINEKYKNFFPFSTKEIKIRNDIKNFEKEKTQYEESLKNYNLNIDNYV